MLTGLVKKDHSHIVEGILRVRQLVPQGALAEVHIDSRGGMFCWAPNKQGGSPGLPLTAVAAYMVV